MGKYLITKTISKIKIHPLFFIVAFITLITGFFKNFSYIMLIIIVHECGHILTSLYFKWNIDKIVILPFGGITIFKEKINKPLIEELLIAVSGPIIQIIIFSFIKHEVIRNYHYYLLVFNLLPIIPLDGSKIFNCLSNHVLPFKISHILTIIVSILIILNLFVFKFNLIFLIIIFFLILKLIEEYQNHENIFNKFLMERYLYNFNLKKRKIIKSYKLKYMFRDYKHLFCIGKKYYSEDEILKKRFDI